MKEFTKYLGSILILIGVGLLAFYHFGHMPSNLLLALAAIIMVIGCVLHIVINKKLE